MSTFTTEDSDVLGGPFIAKNLKISPENLCYNNTDILLELKTSTIPNSGRGLFLKEERINEGQLIGYYDGDVTKDDKKLSDYSFTLDDDWFVDGLEFPRCYIAMINDPYGSEFECNCEFQLLTQDEKTNKTLPPHKRKIYLVALRDIERGEELFASYGEDYWSCKTRQKYLKKSKKKSKKKSSK